ncbi:chaperone modulator CbpM [Spirosoma soli]|uniref:Chaperone modulator CbpM n=1 Tax=Spirosoma soli TaxID=1770529 RepID=A0ABW5MDB5_9BACT
MQPEHLISVQEFCGYHHLEIEFVQTLEQRGLIQTITVEQSLYVHSEQLAQLEKFVRLHQELAIHTDDLDIVSNLLERLDDLQHQVTQLQNRLAFYEP